MRGEVCAMKFRMEKLGEVCESLLRKAKKEEGQRDVLKSKK